MFDSSMFELDDFPELDAIVGDYNYKALRVPNDRLEDLECFLEFVADSDTAGEVIEIDTPPSKLEEEEEEEEERTDEEYLQTLEEEKPVLQEPDVEVNNGSPNEEVHVPRKWRTKSRDCQRRVWSTEPPVQLFGEPDDSGDDLDDEELLSPAATTRRVCGHCLTDDTPQWRSGPGGPGTLCNACGIRYKSGRLLPEYRPLSSPMFEVDVYTNSHKRIIKSRKAREVLRQ